MKSVDLAGYLRSVDRDALGSCAVTERFSQALVDRSSDWHSCDVRYIRTPPGGGSPAGLHTHVFDQLFYVISGIMEIEVDANRFRARAGDVVVFPRGVPHRNWNDWGAETVHLAVNVPAPLPGTPFASPV